MTHEIGSADQKGSSTDITVTWLNWVKGFGFLGLLFGLIFNGPVDAVLFRFLNSPFIHTYVGGIIAAILAGGIAGVTLGGIFGMVWKLVASLRKAREVKDGSDMPRVLLVDDYAPTREMIEIFLRKSGYDILRASNGEEAIRLAKEETPDIVVLDISMPGMSGIEVCRTIRTQKLTDAPIMMFTAQASIEAKMAAFEAGADDFLTKPGHVEEFHARLDALLRRARGNQESQPLTVSAQPDIQTTESTPPPKAADVHKANGQAASELSSNDDGTALEGDDSPLRKRLKVLMAINEGVIYKDTP